MPLAKGNKMTANKDRKSNRSNPAKYAGDEKSDLSQNYVRPRDAATLIIVEESQKQPPRILMGKRAAGHKFMPNKFVFPGGRVDPGDSRLKLEAELHPNVLAKLQKDVTSKTSPLRLRALALAAIRETYEETGLIIGSPTSRPLRSQNASWKDYFNHGVVPPLEAIDFIARAVTPTFRVRRFDTRFFMIDAKHLHNDPQDLARASGELTDLHWLTLDKAYDLDLPIITKQVLKILEKRLEHGQTKRRALSVPYFRFRNGKSELVDL